MYIVCDLFVFEILLSDIILYKESYHVLEYMYIYI